MGGLGGHPEGLTNVGPGPSVLERSIDGLAFERRGESTQCDDGGERFGGVVGGGDADALDHGINFS